MLTRPLSIALLTTLVATTLPAQVHAGCLTDWLFGRSTAPYAAQYAPQAVPVAYAAQYAPQTVPLSYSAGYGAAPTALTPTVGAYQVQRPAYYDNPSVYTGRPVVTTPANAQTMYSVPMNGTTMPFSAARAPIVQAPSQSIPIAQTLRGSASPFAGNSILSPYQAAYPQNSSPLLSTTSPGLPLTTTTPTGTPTTALPVTPVTPLFATTPPPRVGGLARFFGSLLGTRYRSSYYPAPITYYRPVTSIDPITGTTVTVQQACTSQVQQLQRTPYGSFQLGNGGMNPQPAGCQTITPIAGTTSNVYPYGGTPQYPASGIGQVGGFAAPAGTGVTPIPSTAPGYQQPGDFNAQPNYYQQPGSANGPLNTAPLQGAPLQGTPPASSGDMAPVDQPRLQTGPTESSLRQETTTPPPAKESAPEPKPSPRSYWDLQEAEDSTALKRSPLPRRSTDPQSLVAPQFTGLPPIAAPDDYESPFRRQEFQRPPVTPRRNQSFEAPPLPEREMDAADLTSISTRVSVPVRDASLTRNRSQQPTARPSEPLPSKPQPVRSNSGWVTIQP